MKVIKQYGLTLLGLIIFSNIAVADIQQLDDVIITQSLCVGQDCVNGESFGFDTIRLKENNLRIHFQDTSTSASFPTNDWRIVINDSSNGGANYFGVEDSNTSRIPFRVEAGAPVSTLHVEADGDVGIKTANPVVDLHIVEGNTPTVRLEQDGSDGFTPQTWDVAGNEANFFIRDVTNGSKLFFRSKPGAPEDSIFIAESGNIGLGTDAPSAPLHIRQSGASFAAQFADMLIQDNATTGEVAMLSLMGGSAANSQITFGTSADQFASQMIYNPVDNALFFDIGGGAANRVLRLNADGSWATKNGATLSVGGSWADASSRALKDNISSVSLGSALETVMGLKPVSYNYKTNPSENRLGFIAEEVPEQVAYNDRKNLSSMDIVAALTKVVQEQQAVIAEMKAKMDVLLEK